MAIAEFIHLRNHSDFSLLQGAMNINSLIQATQQYNMPAVALTDTNNLFGTYQFSQKAIAANIQPIIAIEASIAQQQQNDSPQNNPQQYENAKQNHTKLILLVQNSQGYANLRQLVSNAYLNNDGSEHANFAWHDIKKYNHGLICLSAGTDGAIAQAILNNQNQLAKDLCAELKDIFGNRFYIEIQRHGLQDEALCEAECLQLADAMDIPIVATNNCHFLTQDKHQAQDILACIGAGYTANDQNRPTLSQEHYFKSPQQMQELFKDIPDAIENTIAIAKRCGFALQPTEPKLPTYKKLQGRSEFEALKELAEHGLKERLQNMPNEQNQYQERLKYELKIIDQMGFCGYFLIVADFTQWAKQQNIPVGPGRGSGAGSIVSWALKITDLDPIRYGLLFERFLNPERVSMPDFDIDFCQDLREKVIQYVQNEYGNQNVAQIATFGKLQARAVLRDVGRVLAMPYMQVDRICKLVPYNPADPKTIPQVLQTEPMLRNQYDNEKNVKSLIDIAQQLEGLHRHVSTHAAGIVIGDKPLVDIVPLYRDPHSDMNVTQFNMKDIENVGLVKFDFLGLKTLTVIDKCLKFIYRSKGENLDINTIPLQDKKTFKDLCDKSAVGIFQLESSGMQNVMRQMKPDRFEDLIALVALYRPGPMQNIPSYIARKHGKEKVSYSHPELEPVLKETFGIPVYQEQVMQMAQILADYTLGKADLLRRAMGKKVKAEMDNQRQDFVKGAANKHNIDTKLANKIFDEMAAFAEYGFNKTHAAAYALLAYQTAYLKTHYPSEFMTALLCLDSDNSDRLEVLIEECRKMNIGLLPADINRSDIYFSLAEEDQPTGIRYGLAALKRAGKTAIDKILEERQKNGTFKNIYDFFERCDHKQLNKKLLESLVYAGTFDSLNPNRHQLFIALSDLRDYGLSCQERENSDHNFLFGAGVETQNRPILPEVDDWSSAQKAKGELEAVGFYLSEHPLDTYSSALERLGVHSGSEVCARDFTETRALIAAVITSIRTIRNKKGQKIAFIRVADKQGYFELTAYQEILDRHYDLLQEHRLIFAEVAVKPENAGDNNYNRLQIIALSDLVEKLGQTIQELKFVLTDDAALTHLQQVLKDHSQKGKGKIYLTLKERQINNNNRDITLDLGIKVNLTEDLRKAIKSLSGIEEIAP